MQVFKTETCTLTLKFLNLFKTPKLTCTQIAHNFKKNIVETKYAFMFPSEKKHKIKNDIKKSL